MSHDRTPSGSAFDFTFETLPRIVCRPGAALALADELARLGATRALLVTDPGVIAHGLAEAPLAALRAAGVALAVYDGVQADPPEACVLAATEAARAHGAQAVIGFGGGSTLDTAKTVALLAATAQPLADIYGAARARGPRLPLLQVPTTAGTGSEATPTAVLSTPSHEKRGVISPLLLPDVAVLDARLTLGLPAAPTAMTGVDAMVHAIEAFTSRLRKNPLSDLLAQRALSLLLPHLPRLVADGTDLAAREAMLLGSLFAGMAFANAPVAAVHALASPLGALFHVPHGLANALVLSPVLRFNLAAAQPLYAQLGRGLWPALAAAPDDEAAAGFVAGLQQLVRDMPIPQRLSQLGIGAQDLSALADGAMGMQRLLINNPRPVDREDALALYAAVA